MVKEYLLRIYDFFAVHDFPTLMESIRELNWGDIAGSIYTWLIAVPFLAFLAWTKRYKIIIAGISLGLLLLLLQRTLPPPGENIPLPDILLFIGGTFMLVVVNLYFLFMKD